MKTKYIRLPFLGMILAMLTLVSCDDFLDVRPKSEKLERDLFESAQGFEDAIYGVYSQMQTNNLYGMNLLWGVNEVLAQNLDCNSSTIDAVRKYDYTNDNVRQLFSQIWITAYQTIGYANNILKQLNDVSPADYPLYNYYKGEMLAVRAMLHFDMLRLFASTNQSSIGIPYSKNYSRDITEFSTVAEVYNNILADLQEAETLLSGDADIIKYPHVNNQYYDFLNYRETHFNLYAVQALMARVYWMKGDMTNAGNYAEKVINSGKFPLVDETEVKDYLAGTLSPKETIFGLYSTSYVETCSSYLYNLISFHSYQPFDDNSGMKHLLPWNAVYSQDVEATTQDYRRGQFDNMNAQTKWLKLTDYYTLSDYVPANRVNLISGITLFHTSEMYLIAAEANLTGNYQKALGYFNTEIQSRGLTALSADKTLTDDMLFNEYHKELFGEGQLWYNMKRLNKDITSNVETRIIPASDDIYVIPVPEEEYAYRLK